jgi:Cysteine-rich secretory protein family
MREAQARNLEIPGLVLAHHPGMTARKLAPIHLSATVGMQQRPLIWGRVLMCRFAAVFVTLLLVGCAAEAPVETPAMYVNMAEPGAHLDPAAAASMISQYRQNNGLGSVAVDPDLMKLAEAQSGAMAAQNKLDHDVRAPLAKRLSGGGYPATVAVENVSAGYHTLAEAFSGWRDSPPHKANMLKSGVTKLGIAASYAPNTKYKVFWTLILASTDRT